MYWAGFLFALAAILVSFCKHWYGHNKEEAFILNLTIIEMVFAILSIWISLLKHALHHNELTQLEGNIRIDDRRRSKRIIGQKVFYILGVLFTVLITVILFILPSVDNEISVSVSTLLEYTKFSTTLTLFIALLVDSILAEILSDIYSGVQLDQCKMVIHQLKEELKEYVNAERLETIETYLQKNDTFSLSHIPYIKYEGLVGNPGNDQIHQIVTSASAGLGASISTAGENAASDVDHNPHV